MPKSDSRSSSSVEIAIEAILRRVDQPDAVALVPREEPRERGLRDDQLRLQHAVSQRGDDPQRDWAAAFRREDEVVADGEMKHVHQRGLIRDRRNRAVVEAAVEQQPRVGALLGGGGGRLGERESTRCQE